MKIIWDNLALKQFLELIAYIEKDSPFNAEKVRKNILLKIDTLAKYPEIFSLDKYRLNNDGTFRAFELHRYRIAYCIMDDEIRIIRIRHTKMKPLYY